MIKWLLFSFITLLTTLSYSQEDIVIDTLLVDSTQIKLETRLRKLEDSLLIEKTRRETMESMDRSFFNKPLIDSTAIGNTIQDVGDGVGETVNQVKQIFSPSKIFAAIIIVFLTWLVVKALNWFFQKMVNQFPKRRLQIMRIQPIISVLIWSVSLFSLLKTLFNTDNLWAAVGASSLAVGIGLQDMVKNIFGGLLILVNRPFQVGDRVSVKGNYGEVVDIGLQTTTINTTDDSLVTVPNAAIVNDSVSNANSGALDCMVVVDLWLPINIDVEEVRRIAFEAAITSRYLNIDKSVIVLFFDHFDQQPATNVKIKAYVLDARYEKLFAGDITEAAKKAFSEAGIYALN